MSFSRLPMLADETVQQIALFAATSNVTGPPSGIISLLATCRSLHHCLNIDDNPHLYAEIFRAQFDTSALQRRFHAGQLNARNLAGELKRRWVSLSRIRLASQGGEDIWSDMRRGLYDQTHLKLDLSVAYLMFLESDGKNAIQLIRWAYLDDYLKKFQEYVLVPHHLIPQMPPDSNETALYVWLTYFSMDFKRTLSQSSQLPWLMIAYTFGTFAYPGSFAPWPYHQLPLPSSSRSLAQDISRTPARAIFNVDNSLRTRPAFTPLTDYFGLPISISPPLLSQAATMCWLLAHSSTPFHIQNHPLMSADELLAAVGSLDSFTSASDIALRDNCVLSSRAYTPPYMQTRFATITNSRVYDDEWKRLVFCRDPFLSPQELGAICLPRYRFTKGSLTGEWDGRSVGTQFDTYRRIMDGEPAINVLEDDPFVLHDMHTWNIQEHYFRRLPGNAPLRAGPALNAHLPATTSNIQNVTVWDGERWIKGITVRTPTGKSFYATHDPANPTADEASDEDEEDDDYVRLIITGNSIARSSDVPHHHHWVYKPGSFMYGTVRKWDGLITLKANPVEVDNGQWIWRGYLVGSGPDANWVGRYRDANVEVDLEAYGGVFTMVKRLSN